MPWTPTSGPDFILGSTIGDAVSNYGSMVNQINPDDNYSNFAFDKTRPYIWTENACFRRDTGERVANYTTGFPRQMSAADGLMAYYDSNSNYYMVDINGNKTQINSGQFTRGGIAVANGLVASVQSGNRHRVHDANGNQLVDVNFGRGGCESRLHALPSDGGTTKFGYFGRDAYNVFDKNGQVVNTVPNFSWWSSNNYGTLMVDDKTGRAFVACEAQREIGEIDPHTGSVVIDTVDQWAYPNGAEITQSEATAYNELLVINDSGDGNLLLNLSVGNTDPATGKIEGSRGYTT